jgi:hypothetical protein
MYTAIKTILVLILMTSLGCALALALPGLHWFYRSYIVIFLAYKLTPSDFFK